MANNNAESGDRTPHANEEDLLYKDAELVIYTADEDHAAYEPLTEWGKELGLVSISLWARFDDREIPIWVQNEGGVWLSFDVNTYHPDPADPVSDAFIRAVAETVEDETGEGWGNPSEEAYEQMRDVEKLIYSRVRMALFKQRPPEAIVVVRWCDYQYNQQGVKA
jgi:hypothetical protein